MQKLSILLDDPTFLPNGGTLGFGLQHQYSVNKDSGKKTLATVLRVMKGSDADLLYALRSTGLHPFLMVIYCDDYGYTVMCPRYVKLPAEVDGGERLLDTSFSRRCGGIVIDAEEYSGVHVDEYVRWICSPYTDMNHHGDQVVFLVFLNDPELKEMYGDLSLIVRIGPPGSRAKVHEKAED